MADAAALDAHQHFAAARRRAVDDRLAQRLAVSDERLAMHIGHWIGHSPAADAGIMPHCRAEWRERAPARRSRRPECPRRAPSGSRPAPRAARHVGTERSQALAQHLAPLSEGGPGYGFEQPAVARQRLRPRHEPHQRGCDLRRRHECRGVDVEQNARLASPLHEHGQSPVTFRAGSRRRCARRPRAETSEWRHRTRAATARR
jgi:hypothetical protein